MNNLKKAIQERIQENERHARSLRSQSRHRLRRLNKELNWVLDLIDKKNKRKNRDNKRIRS